MTNPMTQKAPGNDTSSDTEQVKVDRAPWRPLEVRVLNVTAETRGGGYKYKFESVIYKTS